jgi:hypothetical protein
MQLQTFEQLFFSNYSKMKNSFKKFKGLAKDCQGEIRHLEKIQKYVDSMNKFYQPKSVGNRPSASDSTTQTLRLQFKNLKEQSSEVLQLYSEGI